MSTNMTETREQRGITQAYELTEAIKYLDAYADYNSIYIRVYSRSKDVITGTLLRVIKKEGFEIISVAIDKKRMYVLIDLKEEDKE